MSAAALALAIVLAFVGLAGTHLGWSSSRPSC